MLRQRNMTGATTKNNVLDRAKDRLIAGELDQANRLYREVLGREPRNPAALNGLGLVAGAAGNLRAAADLFKRAIAEQPGEPEFHNNLGIALVRLNNSPGARKAFEQVVALDPTNVWALTNMGTLHETERQLDQAIVAYKRALAIDPHAPTARANLANIYRTEVPGWHFTMMNDDKRNRAYDDAIRRLVPGRGVLDIGTGAGLLAMMAARAGAQWVTTCESNRVVADVARDILVANDLAPSINLVGKHSTALVLGVDLPRRADLLVCEIFGSTLINEELLPTLEHARANLLQPDAIVVPRRASMIGCLVGGAALGAYFFADKAVGFSVARFNEFAPPNLGMRLGQIAHEVLSADFTIFDFDLGQAKFTPEQRRIDVVATRHGRCFGIAQWIRLDLAEGIIYENRPSAGAEADSWAHMVHRFDAPIDLRPGDRLEVLARHDRFQLTISRVHSD
jgi:protein arginine N-methyltransferase 7